MVSSTAVTLSFARRSHDQADDVGSDALGAGILLAWVVMFARVVTLVFVVYRELLAQLAIPLGAMAAVTAAAAALLLRRGVRRPQKREEEVPLKNPFSLTAAAKFAAVFAVILFAVAAARQLLPRRGIYLVAGLAGLTDMDAITLSMAGVARQGNELRLAANAIIIAALSNTVVKGGIVTILGSRGLKRRILAGLIASLVVGVLVLVVRH
jgi:uncharacterized membrane protein (DUF4010 family)